MRQIFLMLFFHLAAFYGNAQYFYDTSIPYSTNSSHLTIWNGTEYVPFFTKGINLGISVPGTFPGELAATKAQYARWFQQIKEAGFNNIRLYTLHYPHFYEVLDSFNLANRHNPLLFFQGVWLNEELPNYEDDLFFMTDTFKIEIQENVDCVHGNRFIPERQGKAFGNYTHNVSRWCIGYIIGREVHPDEILTTNSLHLDITSYQGTHFSIDDASASEVWFTSKLDFLVDYENQNYYTQRPVSVSSWPTLDPLNHPEEPNQYEDMAEIDLSKIQLTNAPAGLFVSYHAYPYYPDFVSLQSDYQGYSDTYGPNSYKGYLAELKSHYQNLPLIIAEYGVPSSWGIAHYATSGMNHGGFNELSQGETNIRMLNTIRNTGCGGGIHFAWIDEWFKRTWITDPVDYIIDSRVLWHNISSAEQNYGLVGFSKEGNAETLIQFDEESQVTYIKADAGYAFFEMEIGLKNPLKNPDNIWIAFDTYADELGESILPTGDVIPFRSEFALNITNYSANLFVTEAYDLFGIWHNTSGANQLYRSVATDGSPWYIVRWKNNYSHSDVQFIGNLQVNVDFQPPSSRDAVTIYSDKIKVRIPWSLINVVDPSKMRVYHNYRDVESERDTITEGFNIAVNYNDQWFSTNQRYSWETWNSVESNGLIESLKTSYWVMYDRLHEFNTEAIAVRDSFYFENEVSPFYIDANHGLLKNDLDLDGDYMVALLTASPKNGHILLNNDGSFTYTPNPDFVGYDSIKYCIFDGYSLSRSNTAVFHIDKNTSTPFSINLSENNYLRVYPNPAINHLTIETVTPFHELMLFNSSGMLVEKIANFGYSVSIDVSGFQPGIYFVVGRINGKIVSSKFIVSR
jgi:hypothetical protein